MNWDIKKIRHALGGKLIGSLFARQMVCETLMLLPPNMIAYVTKNVWFFSSDEEAFGYTFDGNDLQNQHFIFLSDELFTESKSQIQYTIIHEIGHVILKHKNSIGRVQTQSEIDKQEKEADLFVKNILTFQN